MNVKNSNKSKRRFFSFWHPRNNQDRISNEYRFAKEALRSQAELTVELAKAVADLREIIDSIEKPEDREKHLEKVTHMSNTAKDLLEQMSVVFDSCDRLGRTAIE